MRSKGKKGQKEIILDELTNKKNKTTYILAKFDLEDALMRPI